MIPGPSSGSSCPGARTTITGPSTARPTTPVTCRSRVEPCHSRAAFGVPIRDERPPARTTPAAEFIQSTVYDMSRFRRFLGCRLPGPQGVRGAAVQVLLVDHDLVPDH